MFISPIDSRVRAVTNKDEYEAIQDRYRPDAVYHDLSDGHTFLDCWCPNLKCQDCFVRTECNTRDTGFIDTYFPTLKQDHPEFFI